MRVLPGDRADAEEEVADEDAAGRQGQGDGEIDHGPLAVVDAGFAHDLEAVRDGLDARERPAAHGEGPQEEEGHAAQAERGQPALKAGADVGGHGPDLGDVLDDAVADEQDVGQDEDDEDRRQHGHRFLDAAQVDDDEEDDGQDLERRLQRLVGRREEAEDGVPAGHDGDGDGQHVVDEQGARRK